MISDKLNTLNLFRDDLSKLRKLITNQTQLVSQEPDSFAYRLSLQSLNHRKQEIEDTIKTLEDEIGIISLDLKLDSPNISSGSIPLEILGNSMIGLQKLVNNIAQSLSQGPIERGPFGSDIIQLSQLQLTRIYPGSFGMILNGIGNENLLGDNLLKDSLSKFKEVLEAGNELEFVNLLDELGFRTINAYKDWLSKLESSNVTMEIKFNQDISNKSIIKTPANMNEIRANLENIADPKLEEVELIGVFVGGNIRNGYFEFKGENQIISGKATADVREKFREFYLGEELKATLDKKTFEGISRIVWTMKDIQRGDGNQDQD